MNFNTNSNPHPPAHPPIYPPLIGSSNLGNYNYLNHPYGQNQVHPSPVGQLPAHFPIPHLQPHIFNNPSTPIEKFFTNEEDQLPQTTKMIDEASPSPSDYDLKKNISLQVKFKHKTVQQNSAENQILPMMVSVRTTDTASNAKSSIANVDLVCVIDYSGSMDGTKIKCVVDSFEYLLKILKDNDRLSVIVFDGKAELWFPFKRMTNENKEGVLIA
jgi:hypothetical protein